MMDLEDALKELYAASQRRQSRSRRIPIVLTFDDGYLDNYTHALPLARELQIPLTIFVIPGFIESGKYFWWLAGDYLAYHTQVAQAIIDGRTYNLDQSTERTALADAIDSRLRYACSLSERELFLEQVQRELEIALPRRVKGEMDAAMLPLTWTEIGEMARSGWISFGTHTMHHPLLACLSDTTEVKYEIERCRQVLEWQLGQPVRTFAYPIGKMEHMSNTAIEFVKAAGYAWALTTIEGVNTPQTDPYLLRRLPGDVTQHWLVMAAELAGLLGVMSRLRKMNGR